MTINQALNVQDRSVSTRDAEVLLQEVLKVERSFLHAHPEQKLTAEQRKKYENFLQRREANEPVAYITGHKEFYGREFKTDERALIPRPETEKLIDLTCAWAPNYFQKHLKATNKPCPIRILELGTGCGNIAITLSQELSKLHTLYEIIATDISPNALALAQENAAKLGAKYLKFLQADLFTHPDFKIKMPYDLLIANLPYVSNSWKTDPLAQPEVVFQEPDIALFGGEDGLDIYRNFFQQAPQFLAEDGLLLIEFNEDQTNTLSKLAQSAFPHKKCRVYQDYAGLDRVLEIQN